MNLEVQGVEPHPDMSADSGVGSHSLKSTLRRFSFFLSCPDESGYVILAEGEGGWSCFPACTSMLAAQVPYKCVDGQRIFVHCMYRYWAAYGYEREFPPVRPRLVPRETWILIHVNA